jgi:hypothetical protein
VVLQVDTDTLRSGGAALEQCGARLNEAWSAFSGSVRAMGDIFGDDDVGSIIGTSYEAAHSIAEAAFTSSAERFGEFGQALAAAADRHDANERQITDSFKRITW